MPKILKKSSKTGDRSKAMLDLQNSEDPGGGALYIFWVRGRAIGKGIDFQHIGISNGMDFYNFGIRNGTSF